MADKGERGHPGSPHESLIIFSILRPSQSLKFLTFSWNVPFVHDADKTRSDDWYALPNPTPAFRICARYLFMLYYNANHLTRDSVMFHTTSWFVMQSLKCHNWLFSFIYVNYVSLRKGTYEWMSNYSKSFSSQFHLCYFPKRLCSKHISPLCFHHSNQCPVSSEYNPSSVPVGERLNSLQILLTSFILVLGQDVYQNHTTWKCKAKKNVEQIKEFTTTI